MSCPFIYRHRRHSFAFTLIELLVVISIIALLVAILLPALSAARDAAQLIQCGSNIRQANLAILMYADDYDERPPFGTEDRFNANHNFINYASALYHLEYLTAYEAFYCPAQQAPSLFSPINYQDKKNVAWVYIGYGANVEGFMPRRQFVVDASPPTYLLPRLSAILQPSQLMSLGESVHHSRLAANARLDGWHELWVNRNLLESPANRHKNDAVNLSFVDGHVQATTAKAMGYDWDTLSWDPGIETQKTPWFRRVYTAP